MEPSSALSQASTALPTHNPTQPGMGSNLRVPVALHIHEGKGTDVPNASHIHSEMMKKVNDLQRTRGEPEEQKQRSEERGQELLQEGDLGKQDETQKGLPRGPTLAIRTKRSPGPLAEDRKPLSQTPPGSRDGQPRESSPLVPSSLQGARGLHRCLRSPSSGRTLTARYCNSRAICR